MAMVDFEDYTDSPYRIPERDEDVIDRTRPNDGGVPDFTPDPIRMPTFTTMATDQRGDQGGGGGTAPSAPSQPAPSQPTSGANSADVRRRLEAVSRGVGVTDQDVADAMRRASGYSGYTLDRSINDFAEQYARRATPAAGAAGSGSGGSARPLNVANTHPQFDDPAARLVEDYALDRFQHRQNPNPNSGTALYERYLREFADTLKGAPYSPMEESQIKTAAIDGIERERQATKDRWIEEVSRRGFAPTSGVALDGLKQIDNHFGGLRTQAESTFATNAINLTRQNRAQRASVYGELASAEEGRLDDALTYAMLPISLADRSFNMGATLTGLGGNPAALSQSAMGVLNMITNNRQISSQNRQAMTQGLMQYLGYMFGGDNG